MSEHRTFQLKGHDLKSAHDPLQLGAPGAQLAVVGNDEAWMRAIQRAYELGRKDMRADIRAVLNEP